MSHSARSVSQEYHEFTKYSPEGLARNPRQLDWAQQPQPFKVYPGGVGTTLSLKPYLKPSAPSDPRDLEPWETSSDIDPTLTDSEFRLRRRIAQFLFFSYGVTMMIPYPDHPFYLRAAPSAGGLYPAEIYLIAKGGRGFSRGIYNYQVVEHSLVRFWDESQWDRLQSACFHAPIFDQADLALVITAVFFRSAWRYEDRAYRRICLDTGHLLGNVELAANLTGFRACLLGGFDDDQVESLLFLDGTAEGPLVVIPLVDLWQRQERGEPHDYQEARSKPGQPELYHTALPSARVTKIPADLQPGSWLPYLHQVSRLSIDPLTDATSDLKNFPGSSRSPESSESSDPSSNAETSGSSAESSAAASKADQGGSSGSSSHANESPQEQPRQDKYNFPFCLKVSVKAEPIVWGEHLQSLARSILERRSTRQYTGGDLELGDLIALLGFTYHPELYDLQGLDPQPDYFDLSLIETFVVANGVQGLETGCYYYAPQAQELRQIRFKNFRREVHYLCLGQDLGRDAAAVVFHTADLNVVVDRYGERAYRYLHLDAGHLGQRLNLAAIRLGLGVSGIGGFFDDQVNEVLGIPTDEAVLYVTTLGYPRSQNSMTNR